MRDVDVGRMDGGIDGKWRNAIWGMDWFIEGWILYGEGIDIKIGGNDIKK